MAQRVRDIHGKFVTPEEYAKQQEELKSKYQWINPEVMWEVPPEFAPDKHSEGFKLVRLKESPDLITWAKHEGHCGGVWYKWTTVENIWHFMTVIDPKGEPHGSWHLKNLEWVGKPHPDDELKSDIMSDRVPRYGTYIIGTDKLFGQSTLYDESAPKMIDGVFMHEEYNWHTHMYTPVREDAPTGSIVLDNKEVILLSTPSYVEHCADRNYRTIFNHWWDSMKEDHGTPTPLRAA